MRSRVVAFLLIPVLLGIAVITGSPGAVRADSDYGGGPDEYSEEAVPGTAPADTRPAPAVSTLSTTQILAATSARVVGTAVEDFAYDDLVLEGTARQVCAGRLLTGSGWAFNEIISRFGGTAGTMYYCRERWDAANDPDCNGTLVNPTTNPNFSSTCWSNHARGRAIDVMVGRSGGAYNSARGYAIVNWLLAPDASGNVSANARALGIQQILFSDRCWNSDGDRGIATWSAMRKCGIGHFDHVHMDLTLRGAAGTVSYWGTTPVIAPKMDTQVFWEQGGSYRQAVSWWNMQSNDEEGLALPVGYDEALNGDWDGDGIRDEVFLWDRDTGSYLIQNWTQGDSLNARMGTFSRVYDEAIPGDWDSDGRYDDMILWDKATGNYVIQQWSNYTPIYRGRGTWSPVYDQLVNGDFDGDGKNDDAMMWDNDSGLYVVHSWANFRWTYRARGTWSRVYDDAIVADLSAGGEMDEMILWDHESGLYVQQSWVNFKPTYVRRGNWLSAGITRVAPGDYDTDGRVDDLFLYNGRTGQWYVWSFHRNVPTQRTSGRWLAGYDVITVGSFMD